MMGTKERNFRPLSDVSLGDLVPADHFYQREVVRWGRRLAAYRASTTDPDASLMQRRKKGSSHPGYHTHYVVDGGKVRIVLAALVTPSEVMENQPMLSLISGEAASGGVETPAGDRRHHLLHHREHRSHRESEHPSLLAVAGLRQTQPFL
jgi:hypothetical protein